MVSPQPPLDLWPTWCWPKLAILAKENGDPRTPQVSTEVDTYHDFVAGEVLKSAYVSMARLGAESSDQYATSAAVVLRDYIQTMVSYMSRDYGDFKFSCLVQERAWAALQIVASATRTGDERACRRSECLWRGRERGG